MLPGLKSQIEEECYMNNIPPFTEELIPNLQNHTQQQNIVGPSDPNTSGFRHHLGSSFSLPSPKSNFSNLPNINDNINITSTTITNNPFGNVFNLDSHDVFQPPLSVEQLTSIWLKEFENKAEKDGNEEVGGGSNHDSNESVGVGKMGNHGKNEGNNYNANNNVGGSNNNIIDNNDEENCVINGNRKGKKKKTPSKSLIAEKKRRQKLSDNMHKLRSVVPKITKMDKISILGDAVNYLNELKEQINDLQSEIASSSPRSFMPPPTGTHIMTSTMSALPVQMKEKLCPNNVSGLKNQPTKVDVRVREEGIVNIHMFCANKPGVLASIMKALDSLGLDVHQANISCFNDFSLDVFKAEQHSKDQELTPVQIKALLLKALDFH
ncbi:helix loop helix DNA-binding domain protein [Medicago truncatula]|uniref:Helix loop helix DNA-binding domain protein n=2 Tax=Medicago truncatula TaxID=3880 RepID=G7J7J9_MEDTR|nr:helix loop helix DNA-binding domain protein [Medicago truncatula]